MLFVSILGYRRLISDFMEFVLTEMLGHVLCKQLFARIRLSIVGQTWFCREIPQMLVVRAFRSLGNKNIRQIE